jgi:hypothetical protein
MMSDPSLGWRWFEAVVGLGTLLFIMFCVYVLAVPEAFSGGDDGDDDTDPDATPLVPPSHGTRRDAADVPPVADVRPVPRLRIRIGGCDRRNAAGRFDKGLEHPAGIPRDASLGVDYVRTECAARIAAFQRKGR